jgi:hypothetical protein
VRRTRRAVVMGAVLALAAASPASADLPNAATGIGSVAGAAPPPGVVTGPNTAAGVGSVAATAAPVVAAVSAPVTRSYAPAPRRAPAHRSKAKRKRPKATPAHARHLTPRDVTAAQERSIAPVAAVPDLAAAPVAAARAAASGERDLTPFLVALVLLGAAAVAVRAAVREFRSS